MLDLSKICDAVDEVYPSRRVQDSRPTTDFIFPADSPSVSDNKGHFPIPDVEHGRNAIARVNQYSSLPKWYKGEMDLKQFVEHVVNKVRKKFPSIEVSKNATIPKPSQVKDSVDEENVEYIRILTNNPDKETIVKTVKEYYEKFGGRTLLTPDRKEIVAYADDQNGKPMYSFKQKAWQYIEDCSGATTSADVDAGIPGKSEPVKDSVSEDELKEALSKELPTSMSSHGNIGGATSVLVTKTDDGFLVDVGNRGKAIEDAVKKVASRLNMSCEFDKDRATVTSSSYVLKPKVSDSRQDEVISYSWDEFEQKLNDYKELNAHSVVIGDKTYILSGSVVEDTSEVTDSGSADYRIEDDREYTKRQLIDRPPLWIKDKDIWEKAVDKVTHGGEKLTTVVIPIIVYKKMGGTKALNKKERAEREAADEKRMQAETSREGIEDSFFRKIQAGDTLRIVRGDHVGEFGEVLEVKEDGSFRLRNLKTDEEFEEPASMFGVFVTVTDSEITDSEDPVSLRQALATILKETDPKLRKRSIQSKVLSFLNAYGMDAEIESDGRIWLNDDDTSVKVDESTVSIKKGGESETEDYALLEDVEKWYNRIKELSDK